MSGEEARTDDGNGNEPSTSPKDANNNDQQKQQPSQLEQEAPPVPPADSNNWLVSLAGVAGNMLEWYDFSCFGFFSDIIGDQFFPPDQAGHAALVQSFAVFGAAFLVRPIGGALIGILGDTTGRKSALETSILLMAVPTFLLGCLPTYSAIGWGATALLVICRLLQGLSVGGQLMSSVVFTLERSHASRWGLWGSTVFAASSVGVTAGSLLSYALRGSLTDEQLQQWGWRVPFLLGVFGVIPGYYLKKYGVEHNHHLPPELEAEGTAVGLSESQLGPPRRQKSVIAEAFGKPNRRALLASCLVPALPAATYYITYIWMAIFMETLVTPPVPHAFAINSAVGILGIACTALGGWIADKYPHYVRLMVISATLQAVLAPILIQIIGGSSSHPAIAFLCQTTLGMLLALWNGAMLPWLISSFPPNLRLTSVSIGYNIAVSVFGGFAPTFATLLVDNYGNASPGFMVSALAVFSCLGLAIVPKMETGGGGVSVGGGEAEAAGVSPGGTTARRMGGPESVQQAGAEGVC